VVGANRVSLRAFRKFRKAACTMPKDQKRRCLFRAVKTFDKTVELNKVGFMPYMMNEGD